MQISNQLHKFMSRKQAFGWIPYLKQETFPDIHVILIKRHSINEVRTTFTRQYEQNTITLILSQFIFSDQLNPKRKG